MFRLFKKQPTKMFDESPWQAARKDGTAPMNVPEIETNEESEEIIMDMNKTTWVAITGEEVIDLRLHGERLGTTALACFDRQLRIRRVRHNSCTACQGVPLNNESRKVQIGRNSEKVPSQDMAPNQTLTTNLEIPNYSSSDDHRLDSDTSNCSISIGWSDQDSCLSSEESSEQDSWVSSTEEEQINDDWDSMQEGESEATSSLCLNKEPNRCHLSHNGDQLAVYLCRICNIHYAPKEYFNLHLKQVHEQFSVLGKRKHGENRVTTSGIKSPPLAVRECRAERWITSGGTIGKSPLNDSNNNKSIENIVPAMRQNTLLCQTIEPERPNLNSIPSKRRQKMDEANGVGRQVSVKTHSTCETYKDVLHQCPFCKAPYLLKDLATHFEGMHATELKLIQDGKDWLAKQPVECKPNSINQTSKISVNCSRKDQHMLIYLPEMGQANRLAKTNAQQRENEDATDQISSSDTQKRKINNTGCENIHQEMVAKPESAAQLKLCDICGSFAHSITKHVGKIHHRIEYSMSNVMTPNDTNLKDPITTSKINENVMRLNASTTTSKNNVIPTSNHINTSNHVIMETQRNLKSLTTSSESNTIIPVMNTPTTTCLIMPAIGNGSPTSGESNVIVPKLHRGTSNLVAMQNVTSLNYPTNIREHNAIIPKKCKTYRCIGCGFLINFSAAQTNFLSKIRHAFKYSCPRCHAWNEALAMNTVEKIPLLSPKLMLRDSICNERQEEMLEKKNASDSTKCLYNRVHNTPTRVAPIQPWSRENNLSLEVHKPLSNYEYSITIQINPPQPEIPSIFECPLCNCQLALTEVQINSLTMLHETVQCQCPKCEVWSMLQIPTVDP